MHIYTTHPSPLVCNISVPICRSSDTKEHQTVAEPTSFPTGYREAMGGTCTEEAAYGMHRELCRPVEEEYIII